jgi:FixJ family two-component response regulator
LIRGRTAAGISGGLEETAVPDLPAIAIIDDDESVRDSTCSLVRSHGYKAYTFASPAEFLQSDRLGDASCIISDIRMPGMSGIELQSHLRSRGSRVPFIFVTAFPEQRSQERATKEGAIAFLIKPFDAPSLIACLDTALKKPGA